MWQTGLNDKVCRVWEMITESGPVLKNLVNRHKDGLLVSRRRQWHPTPVLSPGKSHGWRSLVGCSPWVTKSQTRLSDFTFTFHFYALEKEMAPHSSVLAWRIPGTGEPGGLPSMGSHRVGHDWSDLAAAAAGLRTRGCGTDVRAHAHREGRGPDCFPSSWAPLSLILSSFGPGLTRFSSFYLSIQLGLFSYWTGWLQAALSLSWGSSFTCAAWETKTLQRLLHTGAALLPSSRF